MPFLSLLFLYIKYYIYLSCLFTLFHVCLVFLCQIHHRNFVSYFILGFSYLLFLSVLPGEPARNFVKLEKIQLGLQFQWQEIHNITCGKEHFSISHLFI